MSQRCTAKKKNGQPCRQWAIRGLDKCRNHCGKKTSVAVEQGRQNIALAKIGDMVAKLHGDERVPDPVTELLHAIWLDAAMVAVLRAKVMDLKADVGTGNSFAGPNHLGDATPHVFVAALERWVDKLARHSEMAVKAGIEERRVRIVERQADAFMDVLDAALDALNLNPAQRDKARDAAGDRLTLLVGQG